MAKARKVKPATEWWKYFQMRTALIAPLWAFICGGEYIGKHGKSMWLKGLEESNSAVFDRTIVLHGADYVSDAVINAQGYVRNS
jgi:hypothetical protein